MVEKHTTARITLAGEHYEILVKPDAALNFKLGKTDNISNILVTETIFIDVGKGLRPSENKLKEAFGTDDASKIAEMILKRGELQLTTDQRRRLIEEKRKQIVAFISRNCMDQRTGFPHPPLRIEQAMKQVKLVIDPIKRGEEQAKDVIEELRPILPLKMDRMRIAIKIPPEYAPRMIGVVRNFGKLSNEEWQKDGSWIAIVEFPAGLHLSFLERVRDVTRGNYQTKILK
jgi:ribosome maturation protein SDO1